VIRSIEGFDDEEPMTHARVVVFDDVVDTHKVENKWMLATAGSCLLGLLGVQRPPRQILVAMNEVLEGWPFPDDHTAEWSDHAVMDASTVDALANEPRKPLQAGGYGAHHVVAATAAVIPPPSNKS
jgi:hypothetical protein